MNSLDCSVSEDESDSSPHSRASLVHTSCVQHRSWRDLAVWSSVHRVVLHYVCGVAPSGPQPPSSQLIHVPLIDCLCLQMYIVFGFLFIVLLILITTCAEITIVMCYFQLCNEDYRWWWRSFLSAGSSGASLNLRVSSILSSMNVVGGYLFLYSIWYFVSKLKIEGFVSTVLYFAYMAMVSVTFFLLTGSIGFFACLWFVRKIYGAIKVD